MRTHTGKASTRSAAPSHDTDRTRSATAETVTSPAQLAALPERSIAAHPGTENTVFRRIVLGDRPRNELLVRPHRHYSPCYRAPGRGLAGARP